ncbi:hypothetical protein RUM44_004384 [Polyplax serrata]|uniref:Uncharacterized protein n=1 Tax=Polyplax serrata TaxID=468196 RepID=A0ABR1B4H1_POLSC
MRKPSHATAVGESSDLSSTWRVTHRLQILIQNGQLFSLKDGLVCDTTHPVYFLVLGCWRGINGLRSMSIKVPTDDLCILRRIVSIKNSPEASYVLQV